MSVFILCYSIRTLSSEHFDRALARKKESRKRNLNFHIPAAISCSPNLRLLQNDSSYVTLGDIYDRHCEETGITREDPILVSGEKVKSVLLDFKHVNQRPVCIYRDTLPPVFSLLLARQG